ncbi:hypothetical protein BTM_3970 [Burkholderia thailandensis 34]|nr:hypothetical protein BTM_3970 [Burkholderia thailandensis 34]
MFACGGRRGGTAARRHGGTAAHDPAQYGSAPAHRAMLDTA